jgi:carbon-monoxide dehydrogenase catalytic subunit
VRNSFSDGYGGSMVGTELSDIIFGTPKPGFSEVNLGVLKEDQVNILVHGHSPIVSEMICLAVEDKGMIELAKAKGAVGVVGCNNPKIKQDYGHVELIKRLIASDILVLTTGCANVAAGKAGLQVPEAKDLAGPGLKEICGLLNIPPSLHVGSRVDNSRILVIACALANTIGVDIDKLPLAAAAPEWYSEKAATIAFYAMGSGIFTVLGVMPPILGSKKVTELATSGLKDVFGACFAVEPDTIKAAELIKAHIIDKRKGLGLPV